MIFISHRLEEIYEIADQITVLRDGKNVGGGTASDLPQERLIQMMDMLIELKLINKHRTRELRSEAEQLLAIIVSSIKTARRNKG